jgi:hypothetical protein
VSYKGGWTDVNVTALVGVAPTDGCYGGGGSGLYVGGDFGVVYNSATAELEIYYCSYSSATINEGLDPREDLYQILYNGQAWGDVDITLAAQLPTITSITPDFGLPGAVVTINGTNFGGATQSGEAGEVPRSVSFSGTPGTVTGAGWSPTTVVVQVPANSTPDGTVWVESLGGGLSLPAFFRLISTEYTGTVTISGKEQSKVTNICAPRGGSCPITVWDNGTITIVYGGVDYSANYGDGSTPTSIAAGLAAAINAGGPSIGVAATSNGPVVTLLGAYQNTLSTTVVTHEDLGSFHATTSGTETTPLP